MKHENMNEYALPFAAWELRLYLDTHPEDEAALREYRRLCAMSGGHCNYACHTHDVHAVPYGTTGAVSGSGCDATAGRGNGGGNYGGNRCDGGNYRAARAENGGNGNGCGCGGDNNDSGTANGYNVWSWVDGPWPWEIGANGGGC